MLSLLPAPLDSLLVAGVVEGPEELEAIKQEVILPPLVQ